MGWSNYIVIPEFKLLIEISRYVDKLENYVNEAFDNAIKEYDDDDELQTEGGCLDIGDIRVSDISINHLWVLYKKYKIVRSLEGTEIDNFLLYWLDYRNIEYEIKSEYSIDLEEYRRNGFVRISRR